jgi:Heparinase II/III-like protein
LQEFDKQVFDEGTSYEGSTHYHKLITELYYLAYVILQEKHLVMSPNVITKLQRMISFLVWCTPEKGSLVAIGDDDSGVIMHGGLAYHKLAAIWSDKHYPQGSYATFEAFGLSIIKTDVWHVTLRHHAYHPLQPSGHFHNDVGSITLSVRGVPIFVDPGSFVYTSSAVWRNYFRSTDVHNSSFIQGIEYAKPDDRLFVLDMAPGKSENSAYQQDDTMYVSTRHALYHHYGLTWQRNLACDTHLSSLTITDTWLSKIKQRVYTSAWNFTLAADIVPVQEATDRWVLVRNGIPIMSVQSYDVTFRAQPAWVSAAYGVKRPSHALYAQGSISIDKPVIITVRAL